MKIVLNIQIKYIQACIWIRSTRNKVTFAYFGREGLPKSVCAVKARRIFIVRVLLLHSTDRRHTHTHTSSRIINLNNAKITKEMAQCLLNPRQLAKMKSQHCGTGISDAKGNSNKKIKIKSNTNNRMVLYVSQIFDHPDTSSGWRLKVEKSQEAVEATKSHSTRNILFKCGHKSFVEYSS